MLSKSQAIILASVLLVSMGTVWASPELGQPLPVLELDEAELVWEGEELVLAPWSSGSLKGQWTLLQHLAARSGAGSLNRPAIDEVVGRKGQEGLRDCRVLNIINIDDVLFGASSMALSQIKKNKRKYPDSPMIVDRDQARALWSLERKSSAIMLLDEQNIVRFFKDGKLEQADIDSLLSLLLIDTSEVPVP